MTFLAPGEQIVAEFKCSWRYPRVLKFFLPGVVLFALSILIYFNVVDFATGAKTPFVKDTLMILSVLSGVSFVILGELARDRLGKYVITNHRVISTRGIIGTDFASVPYNRIVKINASQTLIQKLFAVGNVDVSTAKGLEIVMLGVGNIQKVESMISTFVEEASGESVSAA